MIEHSPGNPPAPHQILTAHSMGLIKPGQIWCGLPKFPRYLIGSHGEVLSFVKSKPRILKRTGRGAYPGYSLLSHEGQIVGAYLHHLVAEAFLGPRPAKLEIAHGDGDKGNGDVLNLRYATHLENEQDKVLLGTLPRGEATGHAHLSADDVREMRIIRQQTGRSYASIAAQFGVKTMTAYRAITGQCWSHVQ